MPPKRTSRSRSREETGPYVSPKKISKPTSPRKIDKPTMKPTSPKKHDKPISPSKQLRFDDAVVNSQDALWGGKVDDDREPIPQRRRLDKGKGRVVGTPLKTSTVVAPVPRESNPPGPHLRNGKVDRAAGKPYWNLNVEGEINADLREQPELAPYKEADERLRQELKDIQTCILNVANKYYKPHFTSKSKGTKSKEGYLLSLVGTDGMSPELIRYAGRITVGGPCGVAGWEEIFLDSNLRVALAAGVIWLVIKQHIFSSLWIKATDEQLRELEKLEEEMQDEEDGFVRSARRGLKIHEMTESSIYDYEAIVNEKMQLLAADLKVTLEPLEADISDQMDSELLIDLYDVLHSAIGPSSFIRSQREAVYVFPHVAKDVPYSASGSLNIFSETHEKWLRDPQNRADQTVADAEQGFTEEKAKKVRNYNLLSRIIVFEPLEAYRRGGWRAEDHDKGWRKTVIVKGAIAARWGAPRRFGNKSDPNEGEFLELKDSLKTFGEAGEAWNLTSWWVKSETRSVTDPAYSTAVLGRVPVMGLKGEGEQPDLSEFNPKWF